MNYAVSIIYIGGIDKFGRIFGGFVVSLIFGNPVALGNLMFVT